MPSTHTSHKPSAVLEQNKCDSILMEEPQNSACVRCKWLWHHSKPRTSQSYSNNPDRFTNLWPHTGWGIFIFQLFMYFFLHKSLPYWTIHECRAKTQKIEDLTILLEIWAMFTILKTVLKMQGFCWWETKCIKCCCKIIRNVFQNQKNGCDKTRCFQFKPYE